MKTDVQLFDFFLRLCQAVLETYGPDAPLPPEQIDKLAASLEKLSGEEKARLAYLLRRMTDAGLYSVCSTSNRRVAEIWMQKFAPLRY